MTTTSTTTTTTTTNRSTVTSTLQPPNNNNNTTRTIHRIRKRPVSFGNPALGTYHGYVYTLEHEKYQSDENDCDSIHHDNNTSINNRNDDTNNNNDLRNHNFVSKEPIVFDKDNELSPENKNAVVHVTEIGAVNVQRIVAMVDIPPEQVPEGILNLSRSHRQFMEHVRIVIGECGSTTTTIIDPTTKTTTPVTTTTTTTSTATNDDGRKSKNKKKKTKIRTMKNMNQQKQQQQQQQQKSLLFYTDPDNNDNNHSVSISSSSSPPSSSSFLLYSAPLSPSATAAENAASILAKEQLLQVWEEEEEQEEDNDAVEDDTEENGEADNDNKKQGKKNEAHILNQDMINDNSLSSSHSTCENHPDITNSHNHDIRNNNNNNNGDRTYVALIEMCSIDAAKEFVTDLHQQPYTILDEAVVANVYHVVAIAGQDGVSLMSPFFAAHAPKITTSSSSTTTTTTTTTSSNTISTTGPSNSTTDIIINNPSTAASNSTSSPSSSPTHSTANTTVEATTQHQQQTYPNIDDHYNCAVCLERIDLDHRFVNTGEWNHGGNTTSSSANITTTTTISSSSLSTTATTSILTTVCNHSFHLDCLLQWQDSPCPVCRYDHSGLNDALSQCNICGTTENNYVCLICGVVSCGWETTTDGTIITHTTGMGESSSSSSSSQQYDGTLSAFASVEPASDAADTRNNRNNNYNNKCSIFDNNECDTSDLELPSSSYLQQQQRQHDVSMQMLSRRNSHARQHYDETLHAYALNTETQHVWDFAGGGYVHRLLQNEDDGKIVEVNDPNNTTSQERSLNPGYLSDAQEGEVVHRKLEGFASQYYTLLKSQLEQQRIFYEGRLEEIRREYSVKDSKNRAAVAAATAKKETADLISALKQERSQLRNRLSSLKSKCEKVKEDVNFLIDMNESLEANRIPLRQQLEQAQCNRMEQRKMFEQCIIPPLQEKVTLLMLQLENNNTNCTIHTNHDVEDDRKIPARRN